MATITDPAKELSEIFDVAKNGGNVRGDSHLAAMFGVEPWSADFFKVIHCILVRIQTVIDIVEILDMDDDLRAQAVEHIDQTRKAFGGEGLSHRWDQHAAQFLSAANIAALKMLSPQIRTKVRFPRLEDNEVQQTLADVEQLESWLVEHQLNEHDFIRQAILDGLKEFKFSLRMVRWVGWGYSLESLRQVIHAYMALETEMMHSPQPDAEALLKKVKAVVGSFIEKANHASATIQTGQLALQFYGAASLLLSGKQAAIGLLSGPSG